MQNSCTKPVDFFGREFMVGHMVLPLNDSSFNVYSKMPLVVTRIGSENKIQVNGGSYGKAEYFVIVNSEVANLANAQDIRSQLMNKYSKDFNFEPVVAKPVAASFVICKFKDSNNAYVIAIIELDKKTVTDRHIQLREKLLTIGFDAHSSSRYERDFRYLNYRKNWATEEINVRWSPYECEFMSLKRIKEIVNPSFVLMDRTQHYKESMLKLKPLN